MTKNRLFAGLVAALIVPTSFVSAQSSKYEDLLIRVLKASTRGECPPELMSPLLMDACERQMPTMKANFDRLGPIKSARYRGDQQTPNGPAEVYRVTFENGEMTWMINTGVDGKIVVLFSPG